MKIKFGNIYGSILRKPLTNLLLLFLIVTLFICSLGAGYFYYQKANLIENRFEYLSSMADYRVSQINNWLIEKYSNLEIIKASSPSVNVTNISAGFKSWMADVIVRGGYENLILVNDTGKVIYSSKPLQIPLVKGDRSKIKASIDSDSVLFSDSNEGTVNSKFLRFFVPIHNNSNSSINSAVVIFELDPLKYFEPILDYNFNKSPTMESLLVKAVGDSVVYLNKLRFSTKRKESKYDESNKALKEVSSIKDHYGFVTARDYKNDEVIALIQKVPSTSWFMITKINDSEFNEPVKDLARLMLLTVISSDFLFALILFFIWRKNIVDNYKKMYAAQRERSKVENRFETLVNGVKDLAIFILDAKGEILSWNTGAGQIFGFISSEIVGRHFNLFFKENTYTQNLQSAILENSVSVEGWLTKKDNSHFWANWVIASLKDEDNMVYGFLMIARDLTEKRNIEDEIKKSRDFYLKLLDDFPNPVWRSDTEGKFNYFNKAWINFTGKTFENEKGNGWTFGIHYEDRERVVNQFNNSLKNRENFIVEFRLQNSSGEYRWVMNFGIPFNDMENNFAGYIGSCYDIDERKKYDDTIRTLMRISERLYASLEIDQILDSLVTECIQLTGAEGGFACIKNENDHYTTNKYYNMDHWEYIDLTYGLDDSMIQHFNSSKECFLSGEIELNKKADKVRTSKYFKVRNILSTPLFGSEGELIGFFEIQNKKNNKEFSKEDINLLRSVARNASISISKSLNYEKLKLTELQLRSSESELRELTAEIQYAREAERQNIAREVHDELGQLFTGINLNISLLTESLEQKKQMSIEEILGELYSVQNFVNKGIQTVRDISGSLRSFVLDHLGLIPAIQEYCREIERISNVKCDFNSSIDSCDFGEEKNVALFRVVQEALTNIIRHAEATLMKVSIQSEDGKIKIEISDNGIGIPKGSEYYSHSMGILGMKERTMFIGGKLEFETDEGSGTKIHIAIPVNKGKG